MSTVEKPKRKIQEITAEFRPFWNRLFEHMGLTSPQFGAKLGYMSAEFGEKRVLAIRLFPSELNSGKDYYTELFDWDQTFLNKEQRTLYRMPYNADWAKDSRLVKIPFNGPAEFVYAIKVEDLELINQTTSKAAYPDIIDPKKFTAPKGTMAVDESGGIVDDATGSTGPKDLFDEESFSDMFSDGEDAHYSAMTIRDLYCMLQNVPMSNKTWLNKLIKEGQSWQK